MSIDVNASRVQHFFTASCAGVVIDNAYVLKRIDDGTGQSAVGIAAAAANEDIVGIAYVRPVAATTKVVVDEEHTRGSGDVITLNESSSNVVTGSIRVYNATTDVTVNLANHTVSGNQVTFASAQPDYPAPTDILLVSYRRNVTLAELAQGADLPLDFANQITGSDGRVEFASGKSSLYVAFFDTSKAYAIGQKLYPNASGILTNVAGSATLVGTVTALPSADYPFLGIEIDLNW